MWFYIIVGVSVVIWLVLSWFLPVWIGLESTGMWVLRSGLALVGILAAVLVVLLRIKRQQEAKARKAAEVNTGVTNQELLSIVQEAEKRLASSQSAKGQKLTELPLYFVIGEPGSTKTSTIVHSGLEPELLAGQVYQETDISPTRSANIWFARGAVFAELAGHLLNVPERWVKFVQRLRPGRASQALGGGQAPRAVIVCINAEVFLQPNAQEQLSALARKLHDRLLELAQSLGIRFPVYVLFTKIDRVAYFAEYVGHLSNEEAGQVVGATLPYLDTNSMGVYAEEQTRRVSDSFNRLFKSVADKRPMLIRREPQAASQPNVYEFPREFRKVQNGLVSFLVELCRPSQLSVGPFLRGYYFTGVRPVYITDVIPSQPKQAQEKLDFSEATSMFNAAQMQQAIQQMQQPKATGPRRVPQWVFLTQFFNRILLGDQNALRASASSAAGSKWKRIAFASAAALLFFYGIFMTVSFFKNRAMEQNLIQAVRQLPTTPTLGGQLATLDQLQRLEQVRAALAEISSHQRDGRPLMMRWGLYAGTKVYPTAREAYFQRFDQLMLRGTQQNMQQHLATRVGEPDAEGFRYTYDTLKGYLITTSHADKSEENQSFLPPVLMDRWQMSQQLDADRAELARRQFEFYTSELPFGNPLSEENNQDAIDKSRTYLLSSQPLERIYQFMLSEAAKKSSDVNFPKLYPDAARVMSVTKVVSGAFTKPGYEFMQQALQNVQQYLSGETWVLGEQSGPQPDPKELEEQLRARYKNDFLSEWREFVSTSRVLRYSTLRDASSKLSVFASNSSPLLALFSVVSQNTAVEDETIANAFQPPQFVVPPDSGDRFVGPANQPYMGALTTLQTSVETAAAAPPDDKMAAQATLNEATQAKVAARQIAQNFAVDTSGKVDSNSQRLLEEPILNAEALIRALGPAQLNGKGAGFCQVYNSLWQKYPFSGNPSSPEASLEDVNQVFQPGTGALWTFYQESLAAVLVNQGGRYVPKPDAEVRVNPQFLAFFNNATSLSNSLYPGGAMTPALNYKLTALPMDGVRAMDLTMNGITLQASGRGGQSRDFMWPGRSPYSVLLRGDLGGSSLDLLRKDGLWGVFQFFGDFDTWDANNNLSMVIRTGAGPVMVEGKPLTVRYQLDMKGAPPVFRKGYLSGLRCMPRVAQ
jgi:type VI secretion system protein ImpL